MFSKSLVGCDAFLNLPMSTRCLYFHLAVEADDDGFQNSPKKICRTAGASEEDLTRLIETGFIIPFDSGIIAITHWKIHNQIRYDLYHETKYKQEKSQLSCDENKAYVLSVQLRNEPVTDSLRERTDVVSESEKECSNTVAESVQARYEAVTDPCTEDRLGKVSIGKDSIVERDTLSPAPFGEYKNVFLSEEELEKLKDEFPDAYERYINKLSSYLASTGKHYKSHYATIRKWAIEDAAKKSSAEKSWDDKAKAWASK